MSNWKSLDLFQKADSVARVQSTSGGLVTVITAIIILFLTLGETWDYLSPHREETIGVDRSFGERLNVDIDITFPNSACRLVNFDVVDSVGEEQIAIEDLRKITVTNKAAKLGEGCHVKGQLHIHKVAGNFHFALGKGVPNTAVGDAMSTDPFASTMVGAQHQHRFDMYELQMFNASHEIRRLSFGPDFPGSGSRNPLNGVHHFVESGVGQFNYYLSVVPTLYTYSSGSVIKTNQYSYTQKIVAVESTAVRFPHPGVFFYVSISPLVVRITEEDKSFLHFFTSLAAIVGCVWVVSSFVEALVTRVLSHLEAIGLISAETSAAVKSSYSDGGGATVFPTHSASPLVPSPVPSSSFVVGTSGDHPKLYSPAPPPAATSSSAIPTMYTPATFSTAPPPFSSSFASQPSSRQPIGTSPVAPVTTAAPPGAPVSYVPRPFAPSSSKSSHAD